VKTLGFEELEDIALALSDLSDDLYIKHRHQALQVSLDDLVFRLDTIRKHYEENTMGRPDFKKTTGEAAKALHINVTQSQHEWLDEMVERTGKSKGFLVRAALEYSRADTTS